MIKVMIERVVIPGLEPEYENFSRTILQQCLTADGFISGESLKDGDHPNHRFIFTLWRDRSAWERWSHSAGRNEIAGNIAAMLAGPEKVTLLEHL